MDPHRIQSRKWTPTGSKAKNGPAQDPKPKNGPPQDPKPKNGPPQDPKPKMDPHRIQSRKMDPHRIQSRKMGPIYFTERPWKPASSHGLAARVNGRGFSRPSGGQHGGWRHRRRLRRRGCGHTPPIHPSVSRHAPLRLPFLPTVHSTSERSTGTHGWVRANSRCAHPAPMPLSSHLRPRSHKSNRSTSNRHRY
jgi:hypothetical protein